MALGRCNTSGNDKFINVLNLKNYTLSSEDVAGVPSNVNLSYGYKIGKYIFYDGSFYKERGQVLTKVKECASVGGGKTRNFFIKCGKYWVLDVLHNTDYRYKYIVNIDTLSTVLIKTNVMSDYANAWPYSSVSQCVDVKLKKLYIFYAGKRYAYDLYGDGSCLETITFSSRNIGTISYYSTKDNDHFYITLNGTTLQKVSISDLSVVNSIKIGGFEEVVVVENEYMYVSLHNKSIIRVVNLLTMQVVKDIALPDSIKTSLTDTSITKDYICFHNYNSLLIIDKKTNTLVNSLTFSTTSNTSYIVVGEFNIFTTEAGIFPYKINPKGA